jgi:beta-1,4-mannosyltransferase
MTARSPRPTVALFLPLPTENPYLNRLAGALRELGVEVRKGLGRTLLLQLLRTPGAVVHIHWVEGITGRRERSWPVVRALSIFGQMAIGRILGHELIWTVHNLEPHEQRASQLEKWSTWGVTKLATGIILHCQWAKAELIARYPWAARKRLAVIPHGHFIGLYPPGAERNRVRASLGITGEETLFLMFGHLRPYKGVDELIRTFKQIPRTTGARLMLAGEPLTSDLSRQIRSLSAGDARIILSLESVPHERVSEYFAAADFQVLPYRKVTTSGAAVLGMSLSTAVIAPTIGCLQETIPREAGILFDPREAGSLHAALLQALSRRDESNALGEAGLGRAMQWSWERIAAQTKDLYQKRLPKCGEP